MNDCQFTPIDDKFGFCPVCDPERRQPELLHVRRNCGRAAVVAAKSPRDQQPKAPPLQQQAWNLAMSLAAFVADGLKTVDEKQYQERLEICDVCEHRRGNRCLRCGCWLTLKVRGRAFKCPEEKWIS